MKPFALTYAVAGLGVAAFHALGLPLPWLLGPIAACLLAALAGMRLKAVSIVNVTMRTILGVAVGASFTAALLASMAGMWPTLLLVLGMTACVGLIGTPYFHKLWGFDFPTSYYAAMPGGLQDMLVFGEEAGADVRALSLIHATRVLVIVVALPLFLQEYWGLDLSNPPGAPAAEIAPAQLVLMVVCALGGWRLAVFIGMFGASILGPMLLAAALAVAGLLQHRPPAEAIWAAQFFIGMTVGVKYVGVTGEELRRDLLAAFGYCLILLALTAVFVEGIYLMGLAPPIETLLAFSPGGQAEMAVLALIAGVDMAFVVAHHVVRLLVVILGAPIVMRIFAPRPPD